MSLTGIHEQDRIRLAQYKRAQLYGRQEQRQRVLDACDRVQLAVYWRLPQADIDRQLAALKAATEA